MSGSLIETRTRKGYKVEIHYDLDCANDSPRDWDNGTTLCLSHGSRWKLPNEGDIPFDDLGAWAEVEQYIRDHFEVVGNVLPVSCTDHGDVNYYVGAPNDRWDSGPRVGFIFWTAEGQKACGTPDEMLDEVARQDVETFNQWANGWVYGFVIKDPAGNEIADGSLWGIYEASGSDYEYLMDEATGLIDWDIDHVNESLAGLGLR